MRFLSCPGIGLSNIYNYYPCKDDLLVDVLRPLLAAMYRMLEDHNRPENFSLDIFISDEYHRASLQELMGIITRYRSELNLLFFSTAQFSPQRLFGRVD